MNSTTELFVVVALFLFGGKSAKGSSSSSADDGDALMRRAEQKAALDWIPFFRNEGAPEDYAEALARWAGIESSGNPLEVSSEGERGLLQLTRTTQQRGALTETEWNALISKSTTNQQHAHMAMELANWLWHQADALITDAPDPVADPVDGVWYAKLYHQRPVDVRDGHLHGRALPMARELAERWKNDPQKLHYLRAANVVAFGVPNP